MRAAQKRNLVEVFDGSHGMAFEEGGRGAEPARHDAEVLEGEVRRRTRTRPDAEVGVHDAAVGRSVDGRDLELVFGMIVAEGLDRTHDEGKKSRCAANLDDDVAGRGLDGAGHHLEREAYEVASGLSRNTELKRSRGRPKGYKNKAAFEREAAQAAAQTQVWSSQGQQEPTENSTGGSFPTEPKSDLG